MVDQRGDEAYVWGFGMPRQMVIQGLSTFVTMFGVRALGLEDETPFVRELVQHG
jgi:hypothetical protein